MPEVLRYEDQLRRRAERVAPLEAENAQLRAEVAKLRAALGGRALGLLKAVLDAAPGECVQWRSEDAAAGSREPRYRVTDYEWNAAEGRTPERFSEALYAASRFVYPGLEGASNDGR